MKTKIVYSLFILLFFSYQLFSQNNKKIQVKWGISSTYLSNLKLNKVLEKNGLEKVDILNGGVSIFFRYAVSEKISVFLLPSLESNLKNSLHIFSLGVGINYKLFDDIDAGLFYAYQNVNYFYIKNKSDLDANNMKNATTSIISLYNNSHLLGINLMWNDFVIKDVSMLLEPGFVIISSKWKSEYYLTKNFPDEQYFSMRLVFHYAL